jgi:hypothetical protein
MGEAFDGVDDFCRAYAADPGTSPDAAHDCIHMMHSDDWAALRRAWADRSSQWREGCAYVLGTGPVVECLPILANALADDALGVATEAAIGYAALVLEHGLASTVSEQTRQRLAQIVAVAGSTHLDEVAELLEALDHPSGRGGD